MIATEELDRIAAVDHPDPHSVLGPHEEDGILVVRTFRPDALGVRLLPEDGGAPREMHLVHGLGIFETRISHAPRGDEPASSAPHHAAPRPAFRYKLEVRYAGHDGGAGTPPNPPERVLTVRDPYAFPPGLGPLDLHLAAEGTHLEIYRRLGAHVREVEGTRGTSFAVWAPSAQRVSVTGDFNGWDGRLAAMRRMGKGIWEIFLPDVGEGALYKFEVKTLQGPVVLKSDPYGQAMELRPRTASKVVSRKYEFGDAQWMAGRAAGEARRRPMSIYEVHLGSWRVKDLGAPEGGAAKRDLAERWYGYRELADLLVDYVADMGFTHIELLPDHGAPLRRLLGLPGLGLLRADEPLRHAGRPALLRRPVPRPRHRRHPRLDAGALPQGRVRARPLRRQRALRAPRPAQGRAQALEHVRLQLRAPGGEELPHRQRALLD